MVAFLASDAARGYHGAIINLDNGITAGRARSEKSVIAKPGSRRGDPDTLPPGRTSGLLRRPRFLASHSGRGMTVFGLFKTPLHQTEKAHERNKRRTRNPARQGRDPRTRAAVFARRRDRKSTRLNSRH